MVLPQVAAKAESTTVAASTDKATVLSYFEVAPMQRPAHPLDRASCSSLTAAAQDSYCFSAAAAVVWW